MPQGLFCTATRFAVGGNQKTMRQEVGISYIRICFALCRSELNARQLRAGAGALCQRDRLSGRARLVATYHGIKGDAKLCRQHRVPDVFSYIRFVRGEGGLSDSELRRCRI